MLLDVIPNVLYGASNIKIILQYQQSSILYKDLEQSLLDKTIYLNKIIVLYVLSGYQLIKRQDGDLLRLEEGQSIVLDKDIYFVSDFVVENGSFKAILCVLDDDLIGSLTHSDTETANGIQEGVLKIDRANRIDQFMRSILYVYGGSENDNRLAILKLQEFIYLLDTVNPEIKLVSKLKKMCGVPRKRDIQKFMLDNYLNNLKIEDFAQLTGRSVSTFTREFKALYGQTPNQWLIDQRLQKAQVLLEGGEHSVTDTAMVVGYDNVSHFIAAYKKKFGRTPAGSIKQNLRA